MGERASLECGWCGDVAVYGDDDGLFNEDQRGPCLSCGLPGHISVDEYPAEDVDEEDPLIASWVWHDDDETVAAWSAKYPEKASEMREVCMVYGPALAAAPGEEST